MNITSYVCYVLFCIQGKFMEKNNIGIRNACVIKWKGKTT